MFAQQLVEDASWVGLLPLACAGRSVEDQHWTVWTRVPSDMAGTYCLVEPRPLSWRDSMFSKQTPILSLRRSLADEGFVPHAALCTHAEDEAKRFDCRRISSRRAYLQAVLVRRSIWDRGCITFDSGRSAAYYMLLRADPKRIPEGRLATPKS